MDKEQQDKLWNDLSEEKKKEYRKEFQQESESYHLNVKHCDEENGFEYRTGYSNGVISTLEDLFGEHNINPIKIKTWEDVGKEYGDEVYSQWGKLGADITASRPSEKVIDKCVATLKIAKLIELGYGGMVSEEEWKDGNVEKFCVVKSMSKLEYCHLVVGYEFIAFHTPEQREEFMSYESNRKLVEQYYMM